MAKKPVATTYCLVTPVGRRRLNPYTGEFVQIGDKYHLDAKKAETLAAMGEVEIIEEDIADPWAPKEEPKKESVNEKVQSKAPAEIQAKAS